MEDAKSEIVKIFQEAWEKENGAFIHHRWTFAPVWGGVAIVFFRCFREGYTTSSVSGTSTTWSSCHVGAALEPRWVVFNLDFKAYNAVFDAFDRPYEVFRLVYILLEPLLLPQKTMKNRGKIAPTWLQRLSHSTLSTSRKPLTLSHPRGNTSATPPPPQPEQKSNRDVSSNSTDFQ